MPVQAPPSKTCSNCYRPGLNSPVCPTCGAPTFTPSEANESAPTAAPRPVDSVPAAAAPPSRKTPGWVKVLAVIGGLFVTMIVGCAALVGTAAHEVDKGLKHASAGDVSDAGESKATFKNGVLTTRDVKIQITGYKVIKVGEKGNEYGKKPVIAFWYKTSNLSGAKVDPMDFPFDFNVYQDNNPNAVNELEMSVMWDDDRFRDSQTENIKKGGTVENAIAYELDDLDTPVDLVATEGLDEVIGKTTYELK
jgi:hypothetical protein